MIKLFKLTELKDKMNEIIGGSGKVSLILSFDDIVVKMPRRSIIPFSKLMEIHGVVKQYPHNLRVAQIKAVSDGVLASEVGLEIILRYEIS